MDGSGEACERRGVVYGNQWFRVVEHEQKGEGGAESWFSIEFHNDAVAVLLLDEEDNIVLVRQYRVPLASCTWEIPAGGLEPGESVLEAAARELREETGLEGEGFHHVLSYHASTGTTTQKFHIVFASLQRGRPAPEPVPAGTFDFRWTPLSQVLDGIDRTEITSSHTIIAALACQTGRWRALRQ